MTITMPEDASKKIEVVSHVRALPETPDEQSISDQRSRWRVPYYVRVSFAVSCVAMLFGMDTGSIGPVTAMPAFKATFGSFSPTMHGVIVSSVLIPGALTALIAGALAHRFGHIKLVALGSFIYSIGAAVECGAPILGVFILGRLIKGVGEGLFLSNVYVQVSEMSPSRVRGVMTALPQFLITTGVVCGYFICYGTIRLGTSSAAWRAPLAVISGLGLIFSNVFFICPPSPRWLSTKGRFNEARVVGEKLGLEPKELEQILSQSPLFDGESANESVWQTLQQTWVEFGYAFSKPYRGRTAFGCFIMGMQQFSGIDGVLYYAPTLFTQAGLDGDQATFLASGVSAIVILATTIPATLFADVWGRRFASILGGVLITLLMLLMGSLYAGGQVGAGPGKWVVIVSIYLFAIVFSATWAICFRTFLVESMPRKTRSSASSLAQSSNWMANYIVALVTPILLAKSSFGAYYLFAFSSLLTTAVVAAIMPETRGYSLETIEERYDERQSRGTGAQFFSLSALKQRIQTKE
uniref:Major facilitator superfamily (MFS) profile domain-containing protein n=1 Tax=Bionectria ochroleuca TaxID=29856 RepID=A0A8H7N632_BIOOC